MSPLVKRLDAEPRIVALLVKHWELTLELTRRELVDRYAGQVLGAFWALAHPLLLIGVYLFMFGYVFRVRLESRADLPADYATYLLAGMIPWLALAEVLNKSPTAVTTSATLVKQVVFPVEILPVKTVLGSLLPQAIGLIVLAGYLLATTGRLPATFLTLPFLIALQIVGMAGLAMALAAVGVFLRDLKDIVQIFTLLGIYLVPVLYLPAMIPEAIRPLLYANPLAYLIWCYQDLCYFGSFAHPMAWLVTGASSLASFAIGWRIFRRLKPLFGNAL